jgi:cytochrome c
MRMPNNTGLKSISAMLMVIGFPLGALAQANSTLALDKGCYSCHGSPPRKSAPTFEQLASNYAKYQGNAEAAITLADKLHQEHVFGGIRAHEQLSPESALLLVRWIIDGAK